MEVKRNWDNIKWIFKPDGALRDIYIHEVSLKDWEKVIDLINEKHHVAYGTTGECREYQKIDKNHVIEYLTGKVNREEEESKSASITLGEIIVNCHFFLEDQIEFDITPAEVNSIEDYELIESFMSDLSRLTGNQIILTDENCPTFALVKIDVNRGSNHILSEAEAKPWKVSDDSHYKKFNSLKTKIKLLFSPKRNS